MFDNKDKEWISEQKRTLLQDSMQMQFKALQHHRLCNNKCTQK